MVAELNLFHYFIGDRRRMSFKYDNSLRVRLEKVNKQLDLPFATTVGFLLLAGYLYIKNNPTIRNKPYVASGWDFNTSLYINSNFYSLRDEARKLIRYNKGVTQNTLLHYGLVAFEEGQDLSIILSK